MPVLRDLERDAARGSTSCAARCCARVPVAAPAAGGALAAEEELAEHQVFRPAAARGFSVERLGDGAFRVVGDGVERLIAALRRRERGGAGLRRAPPAAMGVIRALEDAGFEPGDDVEIGGVVFELDPA